MPTNGNDTDAKIAQLADAIRDGKSAGGNSAKERFQRKLFAELEALLPEAVAQAKKGKPALLRLLTRYAR